MPELTPPPDGPDRFAPTEERPFGTLGRYKILDELGRGGCGIVYRALDPSIGRVVAIKTILARTESSAGRELRERFRREARSAGVLSHPNIVTVHDFSDSGDPMFIAMEFVEGRTLADFMSDGALALDFILGVLRSAAGALDYAHAQRIVHRDVKPANFLIDKNGRLKITDFGIAKMLDSEEGLTSTGMVVGTAQYMSPEQISETPLTGRSDQFSLAVIAYEMLTGVKPFQGNSWASVIHAIIMAEPPNVRTYRDSLGEAVNTVLRKALSKSPDSRYASCLEFCEALEQGVLGAAIEKTQIFSRTQSTMEQQEETRLLPTPIRAPQTPAAKSPVLRSVWIGALGGAVIAAGLWLGLRPKHTPPAIPAPVAEASPPLRQSASSAPIAPVALAPAARKESKPAPRPSETPPKQTAQPVEKTLPPAPVAAPAAVASSATPPPPIIEAAPPMPVQHVDPFPLAPIPVVPIPTAPLPPREDQAKRAAEEQIKNARTGDLAAISHALRDFQSAYDHRDLAALQAVWPAIPKPVLEGVRSSFRDASEISMELRPLGEPKISGAAATVVCDRNLRQVILKRALEASGQVRIVLGRAAGGWFVQSVVPVSK